MTMLSSLTLKSKFPLIPPGGLRDPFEYRIVVTACGVVARGCHVTGSNTPSCRSCTAAQPRLRIGSICRNVRLRQRVVVVVVRAVAMVGVGVGVVVNGGSADE